LTGGKLRVNVNYNLETFPVTFPVKFFIIK